MAEIHLFYSGVQEAAERGISRDGSVAAQHAAALIMRGIGFSDHYTRIRSQFVLPTELDEAGKMPLVGIDLSRIAHGYQIKEGQAPTLCPSGLEEVEVADWYIGDSRLVPANAQDIMVGSLRPNGTVGEVVLHTDPLTVFSATRQAIETGAIPLHVLEKQVPDLAQFTAGAAEVMPGEDPITQAIRKVTDTMLPPQY
jgi:hypothetical protein